MIHFHTTKHRWRKRLVHGLRSTVYYLPCFQALPKFYLLLEHRWLRYYYLARHHSHFHSPTLLITWNKIIQCAINWRINRFSNRKYYIIIIYDAKETKDNSSQQIGPDYSSASYRNVYSSALKFTHSLTNINWKVSFVTLIFITPFQNYVCHAVYFR